MYCRACGNKINDDEVFCAKCGTKKYEGTKFCQECGYHTTVKTEFCPNCGAKQRTIVTEQMKNANLLELQKRASGKKKFMKITKVISLLGILIAIVLIIILIARPEPDNIPSTTSLPISPNAYIHDYMGYGDYDVQSYWIQSRKLIANIFLCFYVSISAGISFGIIKRQYKKILKSIKEAK